MQNMSRDIETIQHITDAGSALTQGDYTHSHNQLSNTLQQGKKKKFLKRTLVQALRLCTDRTTHRRSRGIALIFLDHGTRR